MLETVVPSDFFGIPRFFPANPVRRKGFQISCPPQTEPKFRDTGLFRSIFMCVHGVFELSEARERVELGPRRSQDLRGSPELDNGGPRALEDAWMTIS